jgi:hypothetical protein
MGFLVGGVDQIHSQGYDFELVLLRVFKLIYLNVCGACSEVVLEFE